MRSRTAAVLVATTLSLCWVGSADADGPKGLMKVGSGASDGVRWSQRARANGDRVITDFSWREGQGEPGGGIGDARLNSRDPVDWAQDSDLGSGGLQMVEGAALSSVDHLRVEFADGTARTITPARAPSAARRRWPSLAHFRFFFVLLAQQPAMMRLVAVDHHGDVITRIPLASGGT